MLHSNVTADIVPEGRQSTCWIEYLVYIVEPCGPMLHRILPSQAPGFLSSSLPCLEDHDAGTLAS